MQSLPQKIFLENEDAMVAFGETLGLYLQTKAIGSLFLQGDLGAGKTTLVRGILRSFGYTGAVKSPTYTLVEVYEFSQSRVCHFDLYRLKDPEELEFMGIRDYFSPRDSNHSFYSLCLIEWPERGEDYLPEPDLSLLIQVKNSGREIIFHSNTQLA